MTGVPITPDLDASRYQAFFTMDQIWTGPNGRGRIVPRVGNLVYDKARGLLEVIAVAPAPLHTSTLVPANVSSTSALGGPNIIGASLFASSGVYRIYLNTARIPFTLNLDQRYVINRSDATHIKVFRGSDITDEGMIISAMYDSAGNKISENIPLVPLTLPTETNIAMRAPVEGFSTEMVDNYDTVTVVAYSSNGSFIEATSMVVVRTNAVASTDRGKKFVRSISLESDFLSISDSRLLEYPVGMTVNSDSMRARVLYSDGTSVNNLPIDGTKVSIAGLDDLIASESGRTNEIILSYYLDGDEVAENVSLVGPNRSIVQAYRARAITNDDAIIYNVKLFVVPTWVSGASPRWTLRYFLYNLERMDIFEVTNFIEPAAGSAVFSGTAYGVSQNIGVVINLQQASNRYRFYRHPQFFNITLNAAASNSGSASYWTLRYSNDVIYGQGKKATVVNDPVNAGMKRVRVDNGYTILSEWLNDMYMSLIPLVNTQIESATPQPTHVRIRIGATWQREIAIQDILQPIDAVDTNIIQGQDLRLEFVYRDNTQIDELAMGALTLINL